MKEIYYDIVMHTPLGNRYGKLSATIIGEQLEGFLELLNHREPFEGKIDSNGNCSIQGKIQSLMRTIDYTASGSMSPSAVKLLVQGERNTFEIFGALSLQEGEKMYG